MYLLHLTSWIRNPLGLLRLCGTVVTALFQMWSCLLASFKFASRNIFIYSKEHFAYLRCTFYVGLFFTWTARMMLPGDLDCYHGVNFHMSTCQWHRAVLCFPAFHPRGAVCLSDVCSWASSNFLCLCMVPENGNASEMEAISYHSSQCWGRKNFSNLTLWSLDPEISQSE